MQQTPAQREYYRGKAQAYSAAADIIDMTDPARVVPECFANEKAIEAWNRRTENDD